MASGFKLGSVGQISTGFDPQDSSNEAQQREVNTQLRHDLAYDYRSYGNNAIFEVITNMHKYPSLKVILFALLILAGAVCVSRFF